MTVWIEINGRTRKVEIPTSANSGAPTGEITCLIEGRALRVDIQTFAPGILSLLLLDPADPAAQGATHPTNQFHCIHDITPEGDTVVINGQRISFAIDDPRSFRARRGAGAGADGPKPVKAPMPGRVVRILVAPGDEVVAQQGLIVIEAMKMQNELKSPKAGRIARVAPQVGDTVQLGDVLVIVE